MSVSARFILPGTTSRRDDEGDKLLIDSHDGPVADAVWKLYEIVVRRAGPIPTLVEWDNDVPDWPILKAGGGSRRSDPAILGFAREALCLTQQTKARSRHGSSRGFSIRRHRRRTC